MIINNTLKFILIFFKIHERIVNYIKLLINNVLIILKKVNRNLSFFKLSFLKIRL